MLKKILSIMLIIILVTNLVLMILGKISSLVFWGIIIVIAIAAYQGIPRIKAS